MVEFYGRIVAIWQPEDTSRVIIAGKIGMGKSWKAEFYTQKIFRCWLYQPMFDWQVGEKTSLAKMLERERYGLLAEGISRYTIVPEDYSHEAMREEYEELCSLVYRVGAICLVTDECKQVCDNSRGERPTHSHARLLTGGRHRHVSLVDISQRLAHMAVDIRSNANRMICFRQSETDDVGAFEERIFPLETPKPINMLSKREYINWQETDETVEIDLRSTNIVE